MIHWMECYLCWGCMSIGLCKNHRNTYEIMRIRVQYRKFIKPSAPTQARLKTLKLSLIDQQVHPVYVPLILYYKAPESSTNCKYEIREKLSQLEGSLSEALNLFYPLAGRFGKDGLSIECSDLGVEYLVTHVDGLLIQIVEPGKQSDVHAELLNALVPAGPDVADHSTPLARLQVNIFECGGLVLGILVAHKLADAYTIIAFIHGWATACRAGTLAEVTSPSYELLLPPFMEPRGKLPRLKEPSLPSRGSGLVVTRRFVFNQKAIMRLKNLAFLEKNRGTSKVGIIMAVIWKSLIDVSKSEHGYMRPSMLVFPMNMRGKISSSSQVPDNLCRNFLHLAFTACYKPPQDANCVLDDLLNVINDAKTSAVEAFERRISDADLQIGNCDDDGVNLQGEMDTVAMTSWCNFQIYEADCGWGKPVWVSSVRKRTPGVILMDSKCGEGVEAWVGLSGKLAMLLFQNQPLILPFTS